MARSPVRSPKPATLRLLSCRPPCRYPALAVASLLTLLALPAAASVPDGARLSDPDPQTKGCTEGPALRAAAVAVHPSGDARCAATDRECFDRRLAEARRLVAEHPDEILAHLAYQALFEEGPLAKRQAMETLRAEYALRLAEHPDDPMMRYLAGRVQPREQATEAVRRATREMPTSPWPHLDLMSLTFDFPYRPASSDPHLERFLARCDSPPAWFYSYPASSIGSDAFWRRHHVSLRAAVEGLEPEERLRALRELWTLEFRVTPVEEHDALRRRVLADLAPFVDAGLEDSPQLWIVRREGFRLAEDEAAERALTEEIDKRLPCHFLAAAGRAGRWAEAHGESQTLATLYDRLQGRRGDWPTSAALYAATGQWLKRCPRNLGYAKLRLSAGVRLESVGDDQLAADAERVVELFDPVTTVRFSIFSPYLLAARALVERGTALERALELTDLEARRVDAVRAGRLSEYTVTRARAANREWVESYEDFGLTLDRLAILVALGRDAAVEETTRQASRQLALLQATLTDSRQRRGLDRRSAHFYHLRADVAEVRDKPLDAIAYRLRAELLEGVDSTEPPSLVTWRANGGSTASWQALREGAAAAIESLQLREIHEWESLELPLEPFEIEAADGTLWRSEDLRGKTVVTSLWASWCAPCRKELPHLEKVRDDLAGRPDVMFLTFNLDRNPGEVLPALRQDGVDLPALLAREYVFEQQKIDDYSIPQLWVIDGEGVLRARQKGFFEDRADDSWSSGIVEQLDRLARQAGPAAVRETEHETDQ